MRNKREERIFVFGFLIGVFVSLVFTYFMVSDFPESRFVRLVLLPSNVEMKKVVDTSKPIARAGEWITDPDSNIPICKLTQDLVLGMAMNVGRCTDWKTPIPHDGENVPFLRWSPQSGSQVHVDGQWRP